MSEDYWDYEKAFHNGQRSHHAQGGVMPTASPVPVQLGSSYNGNVPVNNQGPVDYTAKQVAPGTTFSGGTKQNAPRTNQPQVPMQGMQHMKEGGHAGHKEHYEPEEKQCRSVLYGTNNDRELLVRGGGAPAPFVSPRNEDYNSARDKDRKMPIKGLSGLSIMIGLGGERHKHAGGDSVDAVHQDYADAANTAAQGAEAANSQGGFNRGQQGYQDPQYAATQASMAAMKAQHDRQHLAAGGVAKDRRGGYKGILPKPKNNLSDNGY